MRTAVTTMLGIDFPIFAFTHCRDVVAAVTNAGGLGVLGAVAHTPEQLDIDLKWIREQVKGRPFGVDLLIPSKYAGASEGGFDAASLKSMVPDEHREWLERLLERYDIPGLPEPANTGRGPSASARGFGAVAAAAVSTSERPSSAAGQIAGRVACSDSRSARPA